MMALVQMGPQPLSVDVALGSQLRRASSEHRFCSVS